MVACRRLARVGRRCGWICAAYACSADMAVRRLLWRLSHGHRLLTRRDCSSTASTSWSTSLPRRRNAVPVILLRVSHPSRLVVSVHRSLRVLFRPRGSPIERDGASSSARSRSSLFEVPGIYHTSGLCLVSVPIALHLYLCMSLCCLVLLYRGYPGNTDRPTGTGTEPKPDCRFGAEPERAGRGPRWRTVTVASSSTANRHW